jgi:uncharacterized protein (TIGR02300 family)
MGAGASPVPKLDLGEKQICPNCGSKFYDLRKRPAHCPKCGHVFDPEDELVKATRAKVRMTSYVSKPESDEEEDEDEDALIKLNKAAAADDEDAELESDDEVTPEIDAAAIDEPPLLMDEDGDDDVGGGGAGPADPLPEGFSEGELEEDDPTEGDDEVPFLEDEDEDFGDDLGDLPDGAEDDEP